MPKSTAQHRPLSHSSAQKLLTCEQKFMFYKDKVKPDVPQKSESLVIGSSFHYVLEMSKHEKPNSMGKLLSHCMLTGFEDKVTGEYSTLPKEFAPMVAAMVLKYCELHRKSGLKVLAVETEGKTPYWLGYIDAIMGEAEGPGWWIVDLKTAARWDEMKIPLLTRDPQLNLYAAHANLLGEVVGRKASDFLGCRYRVTTKCKWVRKKGESAKDYCIRMYKDGIKSYDVVIPVGLMNPEERLELHTMSHIIAEELHTKRSDTMRNYTACLDWNRPCEYWSRCFGEKHARMMLKSGLKVLREE